MLTSFGKELRKIRIDKNELLADMADKLNVTVSYLSAVELGKRDAPEEWLDVITKHYDLTSERVDDLMNSYAESKKVLKLDVTNSNPQTKKVALAFARKLNNTNEDLMKKILKILENLEE